MNATRREEIAHIAPTAGPLGQAAILELLGEVERLEASGCCQDCDGTGNDCWTCRGTGHPHEGSCYHLQVLRMDRAIDAAKDAERLRGELDRMRAERDPRRALPDRRDLLDELESFAVDCADLDAEVKRLRAECADRDAEAANLRAELAATKAEVDRLSVPRCNAQQPGKVCFWSDEPPDWSLTQPGDHWHDTSIQ